MSESNCPLEPDTFLMQPSFSAIFTGVYEWFDWFQHSMSLNINLKFVQFIRVSSGRQMVAPLVTSITHLQRYELLGTTVHRNLPQLHPTFFPQHPAPVLPSPLPRPSSSSRTTLHSSRAHVPHSSCSHPAFPIRIRQ